MEYDHASYRLECLKLANCQPHLTTAELIEAAQKMYDFVMGTSGVQPPSETKMAA